MSPDFAGCRGTGQEALDAPTREQDLRTILHTLLRDYAIAAAPTDILPATELQPVLLGLFGEVGSIMAAAKKLHREDRAFIGYKHAVVEEFGDALWYLGAICRRTSFALESIFDSSHAAAGQALLPFSPPLGARRIAVIPDLDPTLRRLGEAATALLAMSPGAGDVSANLHSFAS